MKEYYTYAYLREDGTPYYIGKGKGNRVYQRKKRDIKPPKDKSRIIFLKQNLIEEEAFKHEKYMIAVFGRKDLETGILWNRTNGGEGTYGKVFSEKTRIKISNSKRGKKRSEFSLEWRKKISKSNTGKMHSEESKKKISESNRGRKWSDESKKKYSEKCKSKYLKQKNPMYGKKHTEEAKRKMGETHKKRNLIKHGKMYEFYIDGKYFKEFNTIDELSRKYGIPRTTLRNKIKEVC